MSLSFISFPSDFRPPLFGAFFFSARRRVECSMIVYRLETRDGVGPYNSPSCEGMSALDKEEVGLTGWDPSSRRPTLDIDNIDYEEPQGLAFDLGPMIFGFIDVPQLCHWWRADELTEVQKLCQLPLFVATWDAKRTWAGWHQIVFLQKEARLVERVPLPTFIARERGEL